MTKTAPPMPSPKPMPVTELPGWGGIDKTKVQGQAQLGTMPVNPGKPGDK